MGFKHLVMIGVMATGLSGLVVPLSFALPADAIPKPNVVVFLVDDLGVMDTSIPSLTDADGKPKRYPLNDYYRTPNMDRLAAQGIRFETFYANSVCSPSRVSLITGQSSARHKTTQWIDPAKKNPGPAGWNWVGPDSRSVTLPQLLQTAGYRTIHVGKAHFGGKDCEGEEPLNLGFDVNVAGAGIGRPASYYGEKSYGSGDLRQPPHLEAYHGTETFLTEALTLEAIKKVDEAVKLGKPFFLYMAHYAVHSPFEPDPRFAAHYQHLAKDDKMPAFASLVEGMDKSLGDLLDHFQQLGQAENTLIFFLGDNGSDAPVGARPGETQATGYASSAPLRGKKGSCYEGGMRVPFIAAWARPDKTNPWQQRFPIAQGEICCTEFATVEDLMPSILALTGIEAPPAHVMDGVNILPALAKAGTPTGRDRFLMHFPHNHRSNNFTSYREGNWKIIRHYDDGIDELYDLSSDPFEEKDLASSHPEELIRMQASMQAQLDRANAQYWKGLKK